MAPLDDGVELAQEYEMALTLRGEPLDTEYTSTMTER